jgi:hypothetical protein
VHQPEPLVDVRQWHGVGDHRIDLDLALHVPIDDFRHVRAAARPPNAVRLQTRPVTSWNGRVAISAPAGATPMMMDWPPTLPRREVSLRPNHDRSGSDA